MPAGIVKEEEQLNQIYISGLSRRKDLSRETVREENFGPDARFFSRHHHLVSIMEMPLLSLHVVEIAYVIQT